MPFINPYIAKIKENPHIIEEQDKAFSHKGKWNTFFNNTFPIYLEIGTGLGNFFSSQVGKYPEINFIGMEIKFKRVYKTSEKAKENGGKNFVILKQKGQEINNIFGEQEITHTYIYFPDPWDNKESQKKHKLLQADFLQDLFEITKVGGKLFFKTDHKVYFNSVMEVIGSLNLWHIERFSYDYESEIDSFDTKEITEFEGLFRGENKKICYLECVK